MDKGMEKSRKTRKSRRKQWDEMAIWVQKKGYAMRWEKVVVFYHNSIPYWQAKK